MAKPRNVRLEIHPEHPEPRRIAQAVQRLEAGEVVVVPTDTIYGLAADMDNRGAIEALYSLRGLDRKKPLSLVCGSVSEAARYAAISDGCYQFMKRAMPGPYTILAPATKAAPKMGDTKRRVVGIRIPRHPVALALASALGRPLLSTSAIVPGEPEASLSDPWALAEHYGAKVGMILDAGILPGTPSSVIDWTEAEPVVVRVGAGDVSEFDLA